MRRASAVLIGLILLGNVLADEDAVKKDMTLLEGEWSMVSGTLIGVSWPEELIKTGKQRIAKNGETTVILSGQIFLKAKFTIDPSKKPKAIDYEITYGSTKGTKQLGIYKLEGDQVEFCFAPPGKKDRPTEFSGRELTLSVWKREKKSDKKENK